MGHGYCRVQAQPEIAEPAARHRSPAQGLVVAKRGDWDKAHKIVMDEDAERPPGVHAHLHRVEGDRGNAEYWYRQAKKPAAAGPLDKEWDAIVAALLESGDD